MQDLFIYLSVRLRRTWLLPSKKEHLISLSYILQRYLHTLERCLFLYHAAMLLLKRDWTGICLLRLYLFRKLLLIFHRTQFQLAQNIVYRFLQDCFGLSPRALSLHRQACHYVSECWHSRVQPYPHVASYHTQVSNKTMLIHSPFGCTSLHPSQKVARMAAR